MGIRKTRKKVKVKVQKAYPGPSQCHPRCGRETPAGGCLPRDILEKASSALGISQKGAGMNSQKQLVDSISKHLGVDPHNQRSLLESLPLTPEEKQTLAKKWLRPAQPLEWKDDPDKWLDSNNIRDVMTQYEESNPEFKFLGPYPIDFAAASDSSATSRGTDTKHCLIDEMCKLDLDGEELKGKTKLGIVYNLDPHYKSGSHWVANFIDIQKKQCYYFDSYGMEPPKQIYRFMQWLTIQEPKMKLGWNGRVFQRQNSECGMYCLYFLDRMISGEPYLKFCRRAPPDSFMLDMRDWLFST
jgi:hypothetical protein